MSDPVADPVSSAQTPRRALPWAGIAVALAVGLILLFPGDIALKMDQIDLLKRATAANAEGRLATEGLKGSRGDPYGPLPTQIYQLLLLVGRDVRAVIFLRCAGVALAVALSLWSLGSTLRLPRGFVAVILAAPWVWYYCRDPWDNTFCIPLSCISLAALARWLARPTAVSAVIFSAAATAMPLVHLSTVAAPVAIFVYTAAARWRVFWRMSPWMLLGIAIACSTSVPYILHNYDLPFRKLSDVTQKSTDDRVTLLDVYRESIQPDRLTVAGYAFRGGTLLTGDQNYYGLRTHGINNTYSAATSVSRAAHLWMAVGILLTIINAFRIPRGSAREHVARCSLLMICVHAGVLAWADVPWFEHYLVGIFAPSMLMCWIGVEVFWSHPIGRWPLVIVPSAATVACTLMLIAVIRQRDGGQNQYGHTAGNLMAVVDALRGRAIDHAFTDCPEMLARRTSLADLRWIDAHGAPSQPGEPAPPPLILLRRAFPGDARLQVREGAADETHFKIPAWPG